ncbi:MAG TPA: CBS domain-containing protein, partial [Clostridia bacterium]|nr:CBS domain-containing protein [Clostridia bacterium]
NWAGSYPASLSGGMQQRVGLARALANDPDILLMDEAFSALDPLIRKEMQDELLELHSRLRKTILFITHDLDEALKLGDRIAVMKDGEVVQVGTPEEILTNPANDYVRDFVQDVDRGKVLTARSIMIKPEVITSKDGPKVAMRKMKETGLSSVFVVDPHRTLMGIVTADAILEQDNWEAKHLSSVLITDVPTTSPDTPVNELFPMAAETKIPISVVDEHHKLLGIIPRVAILAAMSKKEVKAL